MDDITRGEKTKRCEMNIICMFFRHSWLFWKQDANYRFCKRCNRWQKIKSLPIWIDVKDPRVVKIQSLPEEQEREIKELILLQDDICSKHHG